MAKRRSKRTRSAKRSAKKPLNRLLAGVKAPWRTARAALKGATAFSMPHSSVFAAGVAIGLAIGVALGVGVVWLDGRAHRATRPPAVAGNRVAESKTAPQAVPRPVPSEATTAQNPPALPPSPAVPPAYVEETEPGLDEGPAPVAAAPEAPAAPVNPPNVVDTAPAMATTGPSAPTAATATVAPTSTVPTANVPLTAGQAQAAASSPSPAAPSSMPPQPQSAAPAPQTAMLTPAPPVRPIPQPNMKQAWMKNAVASVETDGRPMIAIVLDDVGAAPMDVPGALALPAPITLSIMTYAPHAAHIAKLAHADGHEILVHVPMEPISRSADPGPNALLTNLSAEEIKRRLQWDLSQFSGYVGINNHMGSKFTQDTLGMRTVLDLLKERGLIYFDSRTIAGSVGDKLAGEMGVTHVVRDVFLDDVIQLSDVNKQLARAAAIARKRGYAVAIGHPHPITVSALKQWIPQAEAAGFVLVPLSQIVKRNIGVTG
jgi:polysaccharide deacetylase 2 family uncharacterized protein YibQ